MRYRPRCRLCAGKQQPAPLGFLVCENTGQPVCERVRRAIVTHLGADTVSEQPDKPVALAEDDVGELKGIGAGSGEQT